MSSKPYKLSHIAKYIGASLDGDDIKISSMKSLKSASTRDISFFYSNKFKKDLLKTKAGAVITDPANAKHFKGNKLLIDNVHLAYAKVTDLFAESTYMSEKKALSSKAFINNFGSLRLIISSPIVLGYSNLIWYLPTILFGLSLLGLTVLPMIPNQIKIFMESIMPSRIYTLFPEISLNNIHSFPRINKWMSSFSFIFKNPLFGWGAASFPILYSFKGESFGHAHNLPIELAISYGILPSLIIFSFYGLNFFNL